MDRGTFSGELAGAELALLPIASGGIATWVDVVVAMGAFSWLGAASVAAVYDAVTPASVRFLVGRQEGVNPTFEATAQATLASVPRDG